MDKTLKEINEIEQALRKLSHKVARGIASRKEEATMDRMVRRLGALYERVRVIEWQEWREIA